VYEDAIEKISIEALNLVEDGLIIGLGSGRAATTFVKLLASLIKTKNYNIRGVPTSLQIKVVARNGGILLVGADHVDYIDIVFDGADQIDSNKFLIKGGGGALLRENILFSLAKKVVIIADESKFVKDFTIKVPVEVFPYARSTVTESIKKLGGRPELRSIDRGYTFFTENGNIILDCDFGIIKNPKKLSQKIKLIAGVVESGIFTRKPDIIYKAKKNGKFEII
jgi:ribose 5-phosphate isomerase A